MLPHRLILCPWYQGNVRCSPVTRLVILSVWRIPILSTDTSVATMLWCVHDRERASDASAVDLPKVQPRCGHSHTIDAGLRRVVSTKCLPTTRPVTARDYRDGFSRRHTNRWDYFPAA